MGYIYILCKSFFLSRANLLISIHPGLQRNGGLKAYVKRTSGVNGKAIKRSNGGSIESGVSLFLPSMLGYVCLLGSNEP